MNPGFFVNNRENLAQQLNGLLIIARAYGLQQRSNDSAYNFTQESNFWYLTGIEEPDWRLIYDGSSDESWLVMPDISETHRIFEGGMSADEAKHISGVKKIITSDESIILIRQLAKKHTVVGTIGMPSHAEYFNFTLNPSIQQNRNELERQFQNIQDIRNDVAKLRSIKQQCEIDVIQKAINVTTKAFEYVHEHIETFASEAEIEAEFSYSMRRSGASGHAYDPIVAAGEHACTLHYSKNSSKVAKRQLVLMDVGAEYGRYAADITRTYCKGEPTKRQSEVHRAVEDAHHQIIKLLAPLLTIEEYQRSVDKIMTEALASIGLASDDAGLHKYFPHAVSHGLGIDVHDSLGAPKYFQENMVLTVEPGIYIPEEGIGVRIEDDILVTKSGRKNLSAHLSTGL